MAERGDVIQLKRKLGFGQGRNGERVVVVQATQLNAALPTVVVVPLDPSPAVAGVSLGVRVAKDESGAKQPMTAVTWHVRTLLVDRLAPGRVGRLRRRTLDELSQKLRLLMAL